MNNTYFMLRHGETAYQVQGEKVKYPWPEPSPILLTEKGKKQIEAAAKKLKRENIDFIYSSDRPRTRQTTEILAEELKLEVKFDPRLREINLGIFGGRPKEEFRRFFQNRKERFFKRPPKGESWNDVKRRTVNFLKEVDKKYKNKKILIVSHGDPLWLLAGVAKGFNEEELLVKRHKGLSLHVGKYRKLEN